MELYLDSADTREIKEAFELGFLTGLTTTPTFMHRHGITDIDAAVVELSGMVPVLQIEALGNTAEEIVAEAKRQDALGLDRNKTVYKIPVSLEGCKACKALVDEGFLVNIHLVYTLQQAYMAMAAGATYICPLVGRLQDQGTDALSLVADCVDAVEQYGYNSKIMFSSVRTAQHVRDAMEVGAHAITVPWKIMKGLTNNHFTDLGTAQFVQHTHVLTRRVSEAMRPTNPTALASATVAEALVVMTASGLGACTVVDAEGHPVGFFSDGDLRRLVEAGGNPSTTTLEHYIKTPQTVDAGELLITAEELFAAHKVDQLVVVDGDKAVGIIDIQDLRA